MSYLLERFPLPVDQPSWVIVQKSCFWAHTLEEYLLSTGIFHPLRAPGLSSTQSRDGDRTHTHTYIYIYIIYIYI